MNKPLYGLLVGAALGALDGATAWFTPAVRADIAGIVIGSTFKGLLAGVIIGAFSRRVHNLTKGILFGLAIGFLLALGIASMPASDGNHYYFEIILPGSIVGALVGYATQKHQPHPHPKNP